MADSPHVEAMQFSVDKNIKYLHTKTSVEVNNELEQRHS